MYVSILCSGDVVKLLNIYRYHADCCVRIYKMLTCCCVSI